MVVLDDARSAFTAPERSLQQRMIALQRANEVRTRKAADKKRIKAGEVNAWVRLIDPPDYWRTAKVFELLVSVPKIGRGKADKILRRERVSPSKTIGGLSERQRQALVVALAPYAASVRRRKTIQS